MQQINEVTNKNSFLSNPLFFRFPELSYSTIMFGLLLIWIIGYAFYIEQILRPPVYDAPGYWHIANNYNIAGIVAVKQDVITFVYPWILSLVLKLSAIINLPQSFLLFVIQNIVYFFSILFVSNIMCKYSKHCAMMLYILLCANIFVLPYVGISLTDALYTSLCIMLFAWLMESESTQKLMQPFSVKWVLIGVGIMSVAIVIRPAALWLLLPTFYCLIRAVWRKKINIFDCLLGVMLGAIPLYLQIALNVTNFQTISFLPVFDLGSAQIKWGIENIKYATWLGGGNAQNFYSASHLVDLTSTELNLFWYVKHPMDAIKLLLFKLVGAFDFDYLVPYPYRHPWYKWIPSFISLSIFWAGIYGSIVQLCTAKLMVLGSRWLPLIIFFSWCSVSLFSALELRFSLPLLSYFIIVSCAIIHFIATQRNRRLLLSFIVGWMIFMPIVIYMAHFIRMQSIYSG